MYGQFFFFFVNLEVRGKDEFTQVLTSWKRQPGFGLKYSGTYQNSACHQSEHEWRFNGRKNKEKVKKWKIGLLI